MRSNLLPVREELDEESEQEPFVLPRRIGKFAWYIYERNKDCRERNKECREKDYLPHVLQLCKRDQWTKPRAQLVDIARESPFFIATHSVFPHEEPVRILSQVADICLAHVIETTVMTEEHASAILTTVSGGPPKFNAKLRAGYSWFVRASVQRDHIQQP